MVVVAVVIIFGTAVIVIVVPGVLAIVVVLTAIVVIFLVVIIVVIVVVFVVGQISIYLYDPCCGQLRTSLTLTSGAILPYALPPFSHSCCRFVLYYRIDILAAFMSSTLPPSWLTETFSHCFTVLHLGCRMADYPGYLFVGFICSVLTR